MRLGRDYGRAAANAPATGPCEWLEKVDAAVLIVSD